MCGGGCAISDSVSRRRCSNPFWAKTSIQQEVRPPYWRCTMIGSPSAPIFWGTRFVRLLARWRLRRALEFFEANLSQDIRLEEVASLVGLSQSQFARAFRVSMSKPPYHWLLDARIRRAHDLLLDKRMPVAEIAIHVGFADQSHLTKVFRRITGATPRSGRISR